MEFSLVLCDDLEGWDGGDVGRLRKEGIYVYLELIHAVVQQKPIENKLKKKKKNHPHLYLMLVTQGQTTTC